MDELEQKLANYTPSTAALQLIRQTAILLLVGVSGAGKDAIIHELLKTNHYHHIVSHTTRQPRVNHGVLEQDGREYHFVDRATVEKMLDEQAFIEAKYYSGNIYGTSVAEIQAAHDEQKVAVTDLEVQGVAEYKAFAPQVRAVFVLPPSFASWQERLRKRQGKRLDQADYMRRMRTAARELQQFFAADYYVPVVNDDLAIAVQLIDKLAHGDSYDGRQEQAARTVASELYEQTQHYLADNQPEIQPT